MEQAVEIPVEVEQAAIRWWRCLLLLQIGNLCILGINFAALLISCPRDGPLHRLLHLLRQFFRSGLLFF